MATKSSRRTSEQKRAERRQRDRERARQATEALLTSEGWQRWLRARAVFHSYSLQNTLLLAHQCAERGITPTRVGGFRAWLKLGRCVRKGEVALWVMAPMAIKRRDAEREEAGEEKRVFFRSVPVFELINNTRDRRFWLTNQDGYEMTSNSLVLVVERRRSNGWQAFGSYTLSRTSGLQPSSGTTAGGAQVSTIAPRHLRSRSQ